MQTGSFYHAVNGIFVKLGRLASAEVILQLPILLYALELSSLSKSKLVYLHFKLIVYK